MCAGAVRANSGDGPTGHATTSAASRTLKAPRYTCLYYSPLSQMSFTQEARVQNACRRRGGYYLRWYDSVAKAEAWSLLIHADGMM